jgi:hypothetical protein
VHTFTDDNFANLPSINRSCQEKHHYCPIFFKPEFLQEYRCKL